MAMLLDVEGVNAKLLEIQRLDGAELENELNQIQNDLRGYVSKHFAANRFQMRTMERVPTGDWLAYGESIVDAIRNGYTVTVEPVDGGATAAKGKCPKIKITIELEW